MSKNNASYEAVEKVVDTKNNSVVVSDKDKEIIKFSKLIICSFVKKNKDFLEDTIVKTCEIFNDFTKLDLINQKLNFNLKEQLQIIRIKKKCENIAINEICEIIKNGTVDSSNATNDTIDLLDEIIEIRKSVFERVINNSDMEEEYVMMNKKILMQLDNTREILHNSKWFLRKLIDSPISQAIFSPVYKSILSAWNKKDPELVITIPEMYGIDMNDIINLIKQIKTIADKNEK